MSGSKYLQCNYNFKLQYTPLNSNFIIIIMCMYNDVDQTEILWNLSEIYNRVNRKSEDFEICTQLFKVGDPLGQGL